MLGIRGYVLGKNGGVPPDDQHAFNLIRARCDAEFEDEGDALLAWLAACVYYQAQAQGASELAALATVYHAGCNHMSDAQQFLAAGPIVPGGGSDGPQ